MVRFYATPSIKHTLPLSLTHTHTHIGIVLMLPFLLTSSSNTHAPSLRNSRLCDPHFSIAFIVHGFHGFIFWPFPASFRARYNVWQRLLTYATHISAQKPPEAWTSSESQASCTRPHNGHSDPARSMNAMRNHAGRVVGVLRDMDLFDTATHTHTHTGIAHIAPCLSRESPRNPVAVQHAAAFIIPQAVLPVASPSRDFYVEWALRCSLTCYASVCVCVRLYDYSSWHSGNKKKYNMVTHPRNQRGVVGWILFRSTTPAKKPIIGRVCMCVGICPSSGVHILQSVGRYGRFLLSFGFSFRRLPAGSGMIKRIPVQYGFWYCNGQLGSIWP